MILLATRQILQWKLPSTLSSSISTVSGHTLKNCYGMSNKWHKIYYVGSPNTTSTCTSSQSTSSASSLSVPALERDIGKLVQLRFDLHQLSRENKYCILTTEPDSDLSSFPRTRPSDTGPYRRFLPSWLKQYPWLHYSRHEDGVYCRACALFAPKQVGGQDLGQFVTKPFKSWGKIFQRASGHATKQYHLSSITRMSEFFNCHAHFPEVGVAGSKIFGALCAPLFL